jgi:hypothetical protein
MAQDQNSKKLYFLVTEELKSQYGEYSHISLKVFYEEKHNYAEDKAGQVYLINPLFTLEYQKNLSGVEEARLGYYYGESIDEFKRVYAEGFKDASKIFSKMDAYIESLNKDNLQLDEHINRDAFLTRKFLLSKIGAKRVYNIEGHGFYQVEA